MPQTLEFGCLFHQPTTWSCLFSWFQRAASSPSHKNEPAFTWYQHINCMGHFDPQERNPTWAVFPQSSLHLKIKRKENWEPSFAVPGVQIGYDFSGCGWKTMLRPFQWRVSIPGRGLDPLQSLSGTNSQKYNSLQNELLRGGQVEWILAAWVRCCLCGIMVACGTWRHVSYKVSIWRMWAWFGFFFGLVYCGVLLLVREFIRRLSKRFSWLFSQLGL